METVLQDLPPGETLIHNPDAGDRGLEPCGNPADGARDEQGAAAGADEGPPRSSGWGGREMRGDAAAAGATCYCLWAYRGPCTRGLSGFCEKMF